ncbi:MAG TPA: hypothetical protein VIF82_03905 [Burkholderiaceae bacterium]|jgi:hypothetical protein
MQLTVKDHFSAKRTTKIRLYQLAFWLMTLVLTLQLVGMAFHKHDLTEEHSDCVSCYLAAHVPSHVPAAPAVIIAAFLIFVYRIALQPIYFHIVPHSFLIPHSHAPPHGFSPL